MAERWLTILYNKGIFIIKGEGLDTEELVDYIGENRVMSKSLKEYGTQKGVSLTCARRLAEFLGNDLVQSKVILPYKGYLIYQFILNFNYF